MQPDNLKSVNRYYYQIPLESSYLGSSYIHNPKKKVDLVKLFASISSGKQRIFLNKPVQVSFEKQLRIKLKELLVVKY